MKKEPDLSDLVKIFQGHEPEYMLIGSILEVDIGVLQSIPQSETQKLPIVFQKWKDEDKEATWEKIIVLCDDLSLGKARHDIINFLSSEETQKYLDRPDKKVSSSGKFNVLMMYIQLIHEVMYCICFVAINYRTAC